MTTPEVAAKYAVQCSWCSRLKTPVGWVVPVVVPMGLISHGICPDCQAVYFPPKEDEAA